MKQDRRINRVRTRIQWRAHPRRRAASGRARGRSAIARMEMHIRLDMQVEEKMEEGGNA